MVEGCRPFHEPRLLAFGWPRFFCLQMDAINAEAGIQHVQLRAQKTHHVQGVLRRPAHAKPDHCARAICTEKREGKPHRPTPCARKLAAQAMDEIIGRFLQHIGATHRVCHRMAHTEGGKWAQR